MNSFQAGWSAFNSTFNGRALIPEEQYGWDTFQARAFRYSHNASYYNNTVYSSLIQYAQLHKSAYNLYKHTRGVYNPVSRQNDLLVSYIYGGSINFEHMDTGAIPILSDDEALLEALRQVFAWSRLGELKSLFIRWGAQFGDVVLNVVDDREHQKTRLEVLHPAKIRAAEFDMVGNIQAVTIEYRKTDDPPQPAPGLLGLVTPSVVRPYVYTQTIDKAWFRTFKDGEPHAYVKDANGKPISEWPNEYGFVPMVIANHKETGLHWGEASFHNSRRKIDEVNDFASLLNDQVRKSVNVLWYFAGVQSQAELKPSTDDRDQTPAIYGPKDSQPHAMIANLPIDQALNTLKEILRELEMDMPELALQQVREQSRPLTAPGIRAGYSDAIGRITEARGNYDHALVRALQMALSIGGFNQYKGFEPFDLDSYDAGDIDFTIAERPVIDDTLSKTEKLMALSTVGTQPIEVQKLILKELDYPDEDIQAVTNEAAANKQASAQNAANANGQPSSDPNEAQATQQRIEQVWADIGIPSPAAKPAPQAQSVGV